MQPDRKLMSEVVMAAGLTSGVTALSVIGTEIGNGGKLLGSHGSAPGMGDACMTGIREVNKIYRIG